MRVFATDVIEGTSQIVGQGVVNSDGSWEVTVEPLDDGKYNFTADFENAAGVLREWAWRANPLLNDAW